MRADAEIISFDEIHKKVSASRRDIELEAELDEVDQRALNLREWVTDLVLHGDLEDALNGGDV